MDTQDRKRPRTEIDAEEDIKQGLTQHPTLYFEDGNLLLRCHQTLFFVHRTLLAKHSVVFRDLITGNTATMNGMACLTTDDDTEDMESLLQMVYDGMYVDTEVLTIETFPKIAGLLRICTKYDIQRPRIAILDRLRIEWPIALNKHDAKCEELARRLREPGAAAEDLIVHPAAVIALLRDCGYSGVDLLSPLFYDLSSRVWQIGTPITGHHFAPLEPEDIERFTIGLNALRNSQMSLEQINRVVVTLP
ncbi:hypothetical protein HWV62_17192 [Athelia sp. TMB]|nr:hypothetical protein HWV62_17192 [Athelia sp. TMB]